MIKANRSKDAAKSVVSIRKVKNTSNKSIEKELDELLTNIGGLAQIIPSNANYVLIKPIIMMGCSWETGITVHPLLIELLIKKLKKTGLEVSVGEGAGWGCKSDDSFKATGIQEICNTLKVPLVDFKWKIREIH